MSTIPGPKQVDYGHSQTTDSSSLPWLPIPTEMVEGQKFTVFKEGLDLEHQPLHGFFLGQLDACGFFLSLNSEEKQDFYVIETVAIEDVEVEPFETKTTVVSTKESCVPGSRQHLRLQCANIQAVGCNKYVDSSEVEEIQLGNSSTIYLCPVEPNCDITAWQDVLLRIVFKYRNVHEDLPGLEILRKQWTYLTLLYNMTSRKKTPRYQHEVDPRKIKQTIIPACCIAMALGSSQTHSELPSVQSKDFSFDLFFNLFLQSWPREEIADLFTIYSDNFSLMNHSGLVNFLQSTVSVSSFQKPPESSTSRQSRVTRPRKIKHVNLMHWEARHFYRTKSQRNINQPTQRPNLIPTSNNNLGTSRSRSEQRPSRSHAITSAAVHSPKPLTHVNSQRQKKTVFPDIRLSQSEFRTIVQRYETDPVIRHQGRLSAQGFYRFLLSRDYVSLTRVRNFGEAPDQMQTMRYPFSHYYLQCAQVIVQPAPAPFEFNSQDGMNGTVILRNRINYIRALRQLLLLGTRCLILECFAKPSTQSVVPGPGRGRQAEPELFISPSLFTNPNKEQDILQENSMRELYAIPIEIVLNVIKKAAFVITPYPLVLVLRVQQLSAQDQCHLGGLLQEYFGEWLLCPPLPKFEPDDAQANTIMERYYGNSHQPMPSPEIMKNKILLNLTRAEKTFEKPDHNQRPQEQSCPSREDSRENSSFDKTETGQVQLTVFVTDPEGEEGLPKHDVSSIGSSGQLSVTGSRTAVQTRTSGTRLQYIKPPNTSKQTNTTHATFKPILKTGAFTMDTTKQIHPRLARMISLPSPEPVPNLCLQLFKQHLSSLTADLHFNDEPNHTVKLHRSVSETTTDLLRRRGIIPTDKSELPKPRDTTGSQNTLKILSCLASLTFARTVQLEHRARKKRLLRRIYSEAYKNKYRRDRSGKQTDKTGPENAGIPGDKVPNSVQHQSGATRKSGLRSLFNKRTNSTTKSTDPQVHKKRPSILQVATNAARRLSNASMLKQFDSSPKRNSKSGLEMLMKPDLAHSMMAFCRRMSIRSRTGSQTRSPVEKNTEKTPPEARDSSEATSNSLSTHDRTGSRSDSSSHSSGVFNGELKIPSVNISRDGSSKRTGSTSSNDLQPTQMPADGKKKRRSCARCSCSSGSKSSFGSSSESLLSSSNRKQSSKDSTSKLEPEKTPARRNSSVKLSKSVPAKPPNTQQPQQSSVSRTAGSVVSSSTSSSSITSSTETEETSFTSTDSLEFLNSVPNRPISPSQVGFLSDSLSSSDERYTQPHRPMTSKPLSNHLCQNGEVRTGTLPSTFRQDTSSGLHNFPQSAPHDSQWAAASSEPNFSQDASALGTKETAFLPSQIMWRCTNQWLAKCRVVLTSVLHVMDMLKSRAGTKALAEYTKHRLVIVESTDLCDWQTRQLLQLVGCQLVPMQINIPVWTGEPSVDGDFKPTCRRVSSVREQIYKFYSVEQVKMTQEAQITGYTLKPARLRMDTCIHTHKYPKEWLFVGIPSSPGLTQAETTSLFPATTAGRWPAVACACCYDPFAEERARDQLRQLHRYRYGKTSTSHSKLMYNSLLPWNISFQILSFMDNFPLVQSNQQPRSSIQDRTATTNMTHKLPRRYQRAASSAAQSGRTSHNHPSPQKTGPRLSKENLANTFNGVQQEHARKVSVGGKSITSESEIRIEGELLSPRLCGVQETGFRQQQLLSAVTTPVLKRSTVSHACTMHDIRSVTNTFPTSPSMTQSNLFSVPYRSCTGLYASNSNIFDLLGAVKIDFIRLPSPESIVIRLKAHNTSSSLESDTILEGGVPMRLFSTNSPVENTSTGYQHLRLHFGSQLRRHGSSSDNHRSRHEVCHSQLCNTLGLWIFCKIDLAIHTPMSLGELVDTVSQELSSRCNSLTRKYNATEQGQKNDGFTSSLHNVQIPSPDLVQSGIERKE